MHPRIQRAIPFAIGLALAAAASAPDAAAQAATGEEDRWRPQWGDWSIAFSVPSGGGAGLGLWRQTGRTMALGFIIDGALDFQSLENPDIQLTQARITVGPALKRYWWRDGPVSPFLHVGAVAFYDSPANRHENGILPCAREVIDGLPVGLGPVDGQRDPERQAPGPAAQVHGVVRRVPLVAVGDGVEVGGVLGVGPPGGFGVVAKDAAAFRDRFGAIALLGEYPDPKAGELLLAAASVARWRRSSTTWTSRRP